MMKKISLLLILALVAGVMAACGGGAGGGETGNETEAVTLEFSGFDEFRYDPESAEVPAGAPVTVTFNNEGVLEHNWLLTSTRVEPTAVTEADAISGATSGLTPGGESTTFSFTAPPPGTYQVVCTVPGHAVGGMVAEFTVTP
jgi:nitrite reductase (NO-forming)